jgi:membrane dipeptidase
MATDTERDRFVALLRSAQLVDGHNDLLWELRAARERGEDLDPGGSLDALQTDLPRLRAGGVGAQFWSVYVPSDLPEETAVARTFEQIDALSALVRRHPDRLERARTADDVERVAADGRVASLIGVEGGHSIGSSLDTLRRLAELGAGYVTLTHADDTPWADSATGERSNGGLTAFGERVVRELNRLGVLVDLSHTSDETMRRAIEVSEAPVVFSHSSARALADVPRNVPDDVLELVARTGGVVMVTFVPVFLTPAGAASDATAWAQARRLRRRHPDDPDTVRRAMDAWFESHPAPPTGVPDVADHVDHVRAVAGVEHVGIGGDFDGSPWMPEGLEDVSTYPALFAELARRGYSEDDLRMIAGRNVLRVMRQADAVAD